MNRAIIVSLLIGFGACKEGKSPPVALKTVPDTADQTMFGVSTLLTESGLLRANMTADTMRMFDDNTRAEVQHVKVLFYAENGQKNATLTSREGTYNMRVRSMEARGMVVVVAEDGRKLETPQLRFDPARNEISSDSAFVLTEPTRRLEGIGFVADPQLNNVKVLQGARASGPGLTVKKP
jgi:LPS export ABC transporter protein LptC